MTEAWRTLDALGATITPVAPPRIRALLDALVQRIGALPGEYSAVLERYGGDIELLDFDVEFEADEPSAWASGGADGIDGLYGLTSKRGTSVFDALDACTGRIPAGWMPIGDAAGGNQICLRVAEPAGGSGGGQAERDADAPGAAYGALGAIAFWDHERESVSRTAPGRIGLTMIAPTFGDFVSRFRISPNDPEYSPH
ncbi:MAG: hypothetical protein ACTH31_06595 [Pseudoclavibacter sp.]